MRVRKKRGCFEGKTVLLTRPRSQSCDLIGRLRSYGAHVLLFPVIRIEPPKSTKSLDRALKQLDRFDWILFTSPNGVRFFLRRFNALKISPSHWKKLNVGTIGQATKHALLKAGIPVSLCPASYTSKALFRTLKQKKEIHGRRFLLPRTQIAPPELRENLKAAGGYVTEATAYRTLSSKPGNFRRIENLFLNQRIQCVIFTSASAVHAFFSIFRKRRDKMKNVRWISIGPVTSAALRRYGRRVWAQAQPYTFPGLVKGMLRAEKKKFRSV